MHEQQGPGYMSRAVLVGGVPRRVEGWSEVRRLLFAHAGTAAAGPQQVRHLGQSYSGLSADNPQDYSQEKSEEAFVRATWAPVSFASSGSATRECASERVNRV